MRNYSIAGKRGQWPAPEDTSLSYLILSRGNDAFCVIGNVGGKLKDVATRLRPVDSSKCVCGGRGTPPGSVQRYPRP